MRLCDLPIELRENKDIVLTYVKLRGDDLGYAHPKLQSDKDVVRVAFKEKSSSLKYAGDDIKSDYKFMMELIKIDFFAIHHVANSILRSELFGNELLNIHGRFMKYLGYDLKNNQDFIINSPGTLVNKLPYVDSNLKCNLCFAKRCLEKSATLGYFHPDIRKNKEIVLLALAINPTQIDFVHPDLLSDEDVINAAIEEILYKRIIKIPENIINNRQYIFLLMLKKHSSRFDILPIELQNNKSFIIKAIGVNTDVYDKLPKDLQEDTNIVVALILTDATKYSNLPNHLKSNVTILDAMITKLIV